MVANKDSLLQTQMDIAIATTDDVNKWLSPDPFLDKYPNISPYANVQLASIGHNNCNSNYEWGK